MAVLTLVFNVNKTIAKKKGKQLAVHNLIKRGKVALFHQAQTLSPPIQWPNLKTSCIPHAWKKNTTMEIQTNCKLGFPFDTTIIQ